MIVLILGNRVDMFTLNVEGLIESKYRGISDKLKAPTLISLCVSKQSTTNNFERLFK